MSAPTTNYVVRNPNTGLYNDLSELFIPRVSTDPSANPTGFYYLDATGNQTDISTLFYPWSTGLSQISFNTNMVSLSTGTDLKKVFYAPNISTNINYYISVDGAYTYSYDASTNYFTVVFADYTTSDPMNNPTEIGYATVYPSITFKLNTPNVQFTLVGGGGGGGANDITRQYGGGGGAGGGNNTYVTTSIVGTYNLQVGGGGAGGVTAGGVIGTDTTVTQSSEQLATAVGGAPGTRATTAQAGDGGIGIDGGGDGGVGGYPGRTSAVSGTDGSYLPIYTNSTSYYYGGGGAGGAAYQKSGASGGLGGGGASGNGNGNNKGEIYTGPNGIYYAANTYGITGIPSTGGGGSGGNGQGSNEIPGSIGGSGIVIITFQAF